MVEGKENIKEWINFCVLISVKMALYCMLKMWNLKKFKMKECILIIIEWVRLFSGLRNLLFKFGELNLVLEFMKKLKKRIEFVKFLIFIRVFVRNEI